METFHKSLVFGAEGISQSTTQIDIAIFTTSHYFGFHLGYVSTSIISNDVRDVRLRQKFFEAVVSTEATAEYLYPLFSRYTGPLVPQLLPKPLDDPTIWCHLS